MPLPESPSPSRPFVFAVLMRLLLRQNALFTAAFDNRVSAVVSSCGFTRWRWNDNERRGQPGDLSDWTGPKYMPRIASEFGSRAENMPFDWPDVLSLIAPRPVFINAPVDDDCFRVEGVRECQTEWESWPTSAVSAIQSQWHYPNCGHDFPPDLRELAWQFVSSVLSAAIPKL